MQPTIVAPVHDEGKDKSEGLPVQVECLSSTMAATINGKDDDVGKSSAIKLNVVPDADKDRCPVCAEARPVQRVMGRPVAFRLLPWCM